jgi:hypothetical protein
VCTSARFVSHSFIAALLCIGIKLHHPHVIVESEHVRAEASLLHF